MSEYFPEIDAITYGGPASEDPLSFNYYDPDREIGSKTMEEHLRFSVAYWHTFTEDGSDPFGVGTMERPWDDIDDPMEKAHARVDAGFEFFEKLGVPYFCFHDRDIAPRGENLAESNENLDEIVDHVEEKMDETGVELLWGTSQLFMEPKYMHGAATSPNADVFAHAAGQVKKAMEVTERLGGENFVFWGGREGYKTLLNSDMGRELDNMGRFLQMAADYADDIGFEGQLLIEPKPREPTKHQYDFDAANVLAFLREYGLADRFALNLEANHATLAGHNFRHELQYGRINDALGSVDANQGDKLIGWDTDEFPTDVYMTTLAMYEILENGGLAPGGLNFDAKVRRESFEPVDLFYGHVSGMDAFARGLEVAHELREDGIFEEVIDERYSSYEEGIGAEIVSGEADFDSLAEYALNNDGFDLSSGRQEKLESILNRYILES
ncbi:xylose isomerase [Halorhabdus amylolytica]|uniref:xylose isomerase n=1 Tax=Halorhabdus amylolytica TaxID=2559573 RepID=UPI0010AA2844|nr:xylose isomerase [Halorhabdus amylolytica]